MERSAGAAACPAFTLLGVRQRKGGSVALDGVDLEIPRHAVTALVGPSGAGKTSLLRLLNRLDDPTEGEILYQSRPVTGMDVRELRATVGFVFQVPVMFPGTLRSNLRQAAEIAARPGDDLESEMRAALDLAELEWSLVDRESHGLSVGQKQRANLARALMTRPETLLMDEPTSALDPETAERLTDTIRRLNRERALTVVMVTHRLAEARRASDLVVVMEAGKIVGAAPPSEMFGPGANARIRAFLEREG